MFNTDVNSWQNILNQAYHILLVLPLDTRKSDAFTKNFRITRIANISNG